MVILLVARFGVRVLRAGGPDPDPGDVVEVAADYRCGICGLRLTITHARGEEIEPPRHCHEPMEEAL